LKAISFPTLLLAGTVAALALSAVGPHDRLTWLLEVAPVLIALPILILTRQSFPLTHLLYGFMGLHGLILIIGGHYTYAEVPPGFWVRDALELSRNPYDRLGHFAQGFVPALLAREILIRRSPLAASRWLPVVVVSICLAFSAFYEMLEWWADIGLGQSAEQFLGTQGDQWDTQWDMFLALVGAIALVLLLSKIHDQRLQSLGKAP
jgi:putative membrane protein